ncbi:MAG: mercuric transporter MerT family protein [Pseudohongiellaceae bacterium]
MVSNSKPAYYGGENGNASLSTGQPGRNRERLLATGGVLGALIASSCCIAPLLLVSLGISGAWIGNLTALEPYKPVFLLVTALFLGAAFWHVYVKPIYFKTIGLKTKSAEGSYCARPASSLLIQFVLWTATVLALLSATVDYWAPLFY